MKLMYFKFLPLILIAFIIFWFWKNRLDQKFYNWVKDHWFFKRSVENRLGSYLYYAGLFLLLISLLDFRGPEEKIETTIPDQRTIVIIDSSASMLVEDIRPNRYEKAILLTRHFIKNAFGHQIAVVLFSDTQKRIVPFTDDLDLLDSRVAGLSELNILNGGSNISQAILESVQYFKQNKGDTKEVKGNILVFTDAEEHEGLPLQKLEDGITLAIVGVGSSKGGPIPLRNRYDNFKGYKKHNGEKVVSKLDEEYLKKFSSIASNYKYWVVQSYSIPTEEILNFFRTTFENKLSKGKITTRPVFGHYIVLLGILILCCAYIFKMRKSFVIPVLLLFSIPFVDLKSEEQEEKIPKEVLESLSKFKEGEITKNEKLELAHKMLQSSKFDVASILYEENVTQSENNLAVKMNYGTSLLGAKKYKDAIAHFKRLNKEIQGHPQEAELRELIRKNIVFSMKQEQSQRQQNKEDQKKQQDQQDQKNQQDQQNQQDQKDQQNKDQKDQGKDQKDGKGKQKKNRPKDLTEKEQELKKKRKMVKIPAMIKQLMGEDRKLQEKYIDTSTDNKRKESNIRDW